MSSILKGIVDEGGKHSIQAIAQDIVSYLADHHTDNAILDAVKHESDINDVDPAQLFNAVWEMLHPGQVNENLHKWFKEKWVRFGPDGKIRGACARGSNSEGKPKCLPQKKAQNLGKKGRKYAANKKRREDPNPDRHGAAHNVATKKKTNEEDMEENFINMSSQSVAEQGVTEEKCPHCGGALVSEEMMNEKQDACYRKVKSRYKVWPSAYASGALVQCRKRGAANWGNKSESVEVDEAYMSDAEYRKQAGYLHGKRGLPAAANDQSYRSGYAIGVQSRNKTSSVEEAASAAQQAAIAINMKKQHKKPKHVEEETHLNTTSAEYDEQLGFMHGKRGIVPRDQKNKAYMTGFVKGLGVHVARKTAKDDNTFWVSEDYTGIESGPSAGAFTAEKTPAINPYGGMKDTQYRGAIGEGISSNISMPIIFNTKILESYQDIREHAIEFFETHGVEKHHQSYITNIREILKNKHRVIESTDYQQIQPFIQAIDKVSSKSDIKIGDMFAAIMFDIKYIHNEIDVVGFTVPKEIVKIKKADNGTIDYVMFSDGDRYPKVPHISGKDGSAIEYPAYFSTQSDAEKALTYLTLALPETWNMDTAAINSGTITEMPDTSGPVGVQPGGWRTYSPKSAGTAVTEEESLKSNNPVGIPEGEEYIRMKKINGKFIRLMPGERYDGKIYYFKKTATGAFYSVASPFISAVKKESSVMKGLMREAENIKKPSETEILQLAYDWFAAASKEKAEENLHIIGLVPKLDWANKNIVLTNRAGKSVELPIDDCIRNTGWTKALIPTAESATRKGLMRETEELAIKFKTITPKDKLIYLDGVKIGMVSRGGERFAGYNEYRRHNDWTGQIKVDGKTVDIGRTEKVSELKPKITRLIRSARIAAAAENPPVEEDAGSVEKRITVKKVGGNDANSWAVLVDGKPAVTGLSKREVPYYKSLVTKRLQEKPHLSGTNIEEDNSTVSNSSTPNKTKMSDIVTPLVQAFNIEHGGSDRWSPLYTKSSTKRWRRGDGSYYTDPKAIVAFDQNNPEDRQLQSEFYDWLLQQPGVKPAGKIRGEFRSSDYSDAAKYKGVIFVKRNYATEYFTPSKLRNSSVWHQKTEEDTAYAGGMGQGHSGESYRKFTPKMAGTFEESAIMSGLKKKSEIAETTSTGTSAGSAGVGGGAIVGGPTTYEQEYAMFKRKGARRITAMTYESELDETLDSKPYDYQQTFSSSNEHMYEFITNDGHEYVTLIDGGPNWVHVSFSVTNEYGNPDLKIQSQKGSPVEDPRRIFATVIAIVKDFTANMKPPHIYFSAAESSRIRLYDAFVRRLDREMPEYELVPEENTKPKKTKMYVLRRKPTV